MTPEIKDIQRAAINSWRHRENRTSCNCHPDQVKLLFPGDPLSPASPEDMTAVEAATFRPITRYKLQTQAGYAAVTQGQLRSHLRRWGAVHYREQYGL